MIIMIMVNISTPFSTVPLKCNEQICNTSYYVFRENNKLLTVSCNTRNVMKLLISCFTMSSLQNSLNLIYKYYYYMSHNKLNVS